MFPCFKCGGYAGNIAVCYHHAKIIGCVDKKGAS
jgi:hypothetical protein